MATAVTYNYRSNYFGTGVPAHRIADYTIKRTINVADACTALGISAFTATDIVKVVDIPDNTLVIGVLVTVITACTTASTQTIDVGDVTAADGWHNDLTIKTTGKTWALAYSADSSPVGKRYVHATDPYITVTFNGAAADGVFSLTVLCVDLNQ